MEVAEQAGIKVGRSRRLQWEGIYREVGVAWRPWKSGDSLTATAEAIAERFHFT